MKARKAYGPSIVDGLEADANELLSHWIFLWPPDECPGRNIVGKSESIGMILGRGLRIRTHGLT